MIADLITATSRAMNKALCALFVGRPSASVAIGGTLLGNKKTRGLFWSFNGLRGSRILCRLGAAYSGGVARSRGSPARFYIGRFRHC